MTCDYCRSVLVPGGCPYCGSNAPCTTFRDAIIEECATAIEPANHPLLMAATKAIRALKSTAPQLHLQGDKS